MDKEMIERLKQNTSAIGLIPAEMQDGLRELGVKGHIQKYTEVGLWINVPCNVALSDRHISYRLRPDYQPPKPEPKIVKYEIYIGDGNWLSIKTHWIQTDIRGVVAMPNFSHFEKANGNRICIENIATEIRNGGKVYACFVEQGE